MRRPSSLVLPNAGEAIDGYLQRASWQLRWPIEGIWRSTGLANPEGGHYPAVLLPDHVASTLDHWWGAPTGTAAQMTLLGRYPALSSGTVEALTTNAVVRLSTRRWFHIAGSRFCPRCLEEDQTWQLSWRLPWHAVCTRHATVLADVCSQCGQWPRARSNSVKPVRRLAFHVADPRRCTSPADPGQLGANPDWCHADFTAQPSRCASPQELETQGHLNAVMESGCSTVAGIVMTPDERLKAWIELALLAAHARNELRARTRLSPPRHTEHTLAWLTIADQIAQQPTPAAAADALRSIIRRHGLQVDKNWFRDRLPKQHSPMWSIYAEVLLQQGRVSTVLRRHQSTIPFYTVRPEQIPQLAWPCAVPEKLACLPGKPKQFMRRGFVSLVWARLLAGDWTDAEHALGFPVGSGKQWSRYVIGLIPIEQRRDITRVLQEQLPGLATAPVAIREVVADAHHLHTLTSPVCTAVDPRASWCPCKATQPSVTARPEMESE